MDPLHTEDIKDPVNWRGVHQFNPARVLLRDVTDDATRNWIISIYKHHNPGVTDSDIEGMEWPDVVGAALPKVLDAFDKGGAPDNVRLLLFGGNHSTWALQMMVEEGLAEKDPTLLKR